MSHSQGGSCFFIGSKNDQKNDDRRCRCGYSGKNKKKQERKEKALYRSREVNYFDKPCCSRSLTDDLVTESSSSCDSLLVPSTSPQYKNPEQVKHKASPPNKKKTIEFNLISSCMRSYWSFA